MNTTTGVSLRKVLLISFALQLLLGGLMWLSPWRKAVLKAEENPTEQAEYEEAREHFKQREKEREKEREDTRFRKEDAERLREEETRKRERKLRERVEKLVELQQELYELQELSLTNLSQRALPESMLGSAEEMETELVDLLQRLGERIRTKNRDGLATELLAVHDRAMAERDALTDAEKADPQRLSAIYQAPKRQAAAYRDALAKVTEVLAAEKQWWMQRSEDAYAYHQTLQDLMSTAASSPEAMPNPALAQWNEPPLDWTAIDEFKEDLTEMLTENPELIPAAAELGGVAPSESLTDEQTAPPSGPPPVDTPLPFASVGQPPASAPEGQANDAAADQQPSPQDPGLQVLGNFQDAPPPAPASEAAKETADALAKDPKGILAILGEMKLEELHKTAEAVADSVDELYGVVRAGELAQKENTPLRDALKHTAPPKERSSLFNAAEAKKTPETVKEMNAMRDNLDAAVADADRMWREAKNAAQQAQQAMAQSPLSPTQQAAMNQAAQGKQGRHRDVSQMMRAMSQGGKEVVKQSSGQIKEGTSGDDTGRITLMAKEQNQFDVADIPNLSRLSLERVVTESLPGRRFTRKSKRSGWLYLDTWYLLGPFENDGKLDYNRRHPPEHRIDLDGIYTGKAGRKLSWRYHQSNDLRIIPRPEVANSTYYGYTEVWFEEPADMLLAVASDDAAKVWINGINVWQDAGITAWRIDEDMRKVFFKSGFNQILIRIENAPRHCVFSVLLCPETQPVGLTPPN